MSRTKAVWWVGAREGILFNHALSLCLMVLFTSSLLRYYVLESLQGLVYFEPLAEPLRTDIADLVPFETEIFVIKHTRSGQIYHRDGRENWCLILHFIIIIPCCNMGYL